MIARVACHSVVALVVWKHREPEHFLYSDRQSCEVLVIARTERAARLLSNLFSALLIRKVRVAVEVVDDECMCAKGLQQEDEVNTRDEV